MTESNYQKTSEGEETVQWTDLAKDKYQHTKEGFEAYLKSRAYTSNGILNRLRFFATYWEWMKKQNLEAEEVSYTDLLLYMKDQQKAGVTQSTIRSYIGTIRLFYEYLVREEQITTNPTADIEVKGVKRRSLYYILEPHELHYIYNNLPDTTIKEKRNKVMMGLMLYQGIKTEEIGKMEVQDVKLKEGQIRIPAAFNSNSREMKLEAHQVMDMYAYILQVRPEILQMNPKRKSQSKQETNKLFTGEGGNCYSISSFITQVMIKSRKLNPNVLNAKQIRASVITKWLKMYNLREVQHMAGHRYVSSTEQYLQNEMEGLKEEVQQFHPFG